MRSFWVGALALLVSCTEQNRIVVHTGAIDDVTRPDPGDDIDFDHVPTDGYVTQKPGFYAVHGMSDWFGVWQDPRPDARPPPPPKGVDFGKDMLFVATAPDEGALKMEVTRIIEQTSGVHVYVRETLGGATCPADPKKPRPMDIVELPSTPVDIQVHHDRVHQADCGPPPDAVVVCRVAGSGAAGASSLVASPGQKIDCDSTQSKPKTGSIVDRGWQIGAAPPGSTTKLTVGNDGRGVTFFVDAWGTYRIGVEIRDQARAASATATVEAPLPEGGIPLELQWTKVNRNDDPSMYPRVELRVVDTSAPESECTATAARSWCSVHVTGTVQRALVRPEPGRTYRAYVVYDDFRLKGAAVACVRSFPKGPLLPKGSQPLSVAVCDDTIRRAGSIWDAGTIDLPTRILYDPRMGKPAPFVPPPPRAADAGAPHPIATVGAGAPHPRAAVDAGAPRRPTHHDAGAPKAGPPERANPFAPPTAPEHKTPF
jgi:hypothetical protein